MVRTAKPRQGAILTVFCGRVLMWEVEVARGVAQKFQAGQGRGAFVLPLGLASQSTAPGCLVFGSRLPHWCGLQPHALRFALSWRGDLRVR
jgi:hypothetical protein